MIDYLNWITKINIMVKGRILRQRNRQDLKINKETTPASIRVTVSSRYSRTHTPTLQQSGDRSTPTRCRTTLPETY